MPKTNSGDKGFAPFVSCELNDDEREYVKQHVLTATKFCEFIGTMVEEGYRASFAFDERNDCVSLIVTGVADNCKNRGMALSGRGPTMLGAATSLAYKHTEKLGGVWTVSGEKKKMNSWG